jgi:mRNA interferase HigB
MKVQLIKKANIDAYIKRNARSRSSMQVFQTLLKEADWNSHSDIKRTFGSSADIVCNGQRVKFNVGGNDFRVICGIHFLKSKVLLFLKFIGTHAEYDDLCNASKKKTGICDVDDYK